MLETQTMTLLLIIILVLLVVSVATRKRHPAGPALSVVLAVLAMGLAVLNGIRDRVPPARAQELLFHESAGYVLGQAVARDFPKGGVFAVLNMPVFSSKPTMHTAKWKGLQKALGSKSITLSLVELDRLPMDLETFFGRLESGQEVPEFWDLVAQGPRADGLISLVGLPPPPGQDRASLPVFAAAVPAGHEVPDAAAWPGLIGYVQAKPGQVLRQAPPPGLSLEEVFALRYELVTRSR